MHIVRSSFSTFFPAYFVLLLSVAQAQSFVPEESIQDRMASFLSERYLQSTFAEPELIRSYYASPMVSYWGSKNVRIDYVLRDKKSYSRRWPVRSYRLLTETLEIEPVQNNPDTYFVLFEYEFNVQNRSKRKSGIGEARLVVKTDEIGFTILGEDGSVVYRF
ncbi:MAG: hypothetical protein ACR2OW_17260 [Methyloligellaceae bacterium]